jgi:C4-type Zn-finger protein
MKLVEKLNQHRRDFQGEYECQGCGHIETDQGCYSYDDDYFHDQVIPKMQCKNCGLSTIDLKLPN